MLDVIVNDITTATSNVLTLSTGLELGIMLVIAIAVGLFAKYIWEVFGLASMAVLILGVVMYLMGLFTAPDAFSGQTFSSETAAAWNALMSLTVQRLIGYYIVMLLAVLIVFVLKMVFGAARD